VSSIISTAASIYSLLEHCYNSMKYRTLLLSLTSIRAATSLRATKGIGWRGALQGSRLIHPGVVVLSDGRRQQMV